MGITGKPTDYIIDSINANSNVNNFKFPIERYIAQQIKAELNLEKEPVVIGHNRHANSILITLIVNQKSRSFKLLAKVYAVNTSADIPVNPSENSYVFLKHYIELSKDIPQLVMPSAIMHLSLVNGYVREWVDGVSLDSLMTSRLFTAERVNLADNFGNAGRILGYIHNKTCNSEGRKANFYTELKLEQIFKQISKSPFKNLKYVSQAMMYLRDVVSTISWKKIVTVLTHGDLVHSNILVTFDKRLSLIDFTESRFDVPYHDLCRFIVRTPVDYGYFTVKYSVKYINELNLTFLKGYLSSIKFELSEEIFRFYSIFNILQFISFLYNRNLQSFLSLRDWHSVYLLRNALRNSYGSEFDGLMQE